MTKKMLFGGLLMAAMSCGSSDTGGTTPTTPTPAATCSDSLKNGTETDVDCGGSCQSCAVGKVCQAAGDCSSASCASGVCAAPTCTDNVKNANETDVDCGGACGPCVDGKACTATADCSSGVCQSNKCVAPSCTDMVKNETETDVDCGGACGVCGDGKSCAAMADCSSGVCSSNKCATASCTDTVKNGTETDVDCGGSCGGCVTGKKCAQTADCATSSICDATSKLCRPATSCAEIYNNWANSADGVYQIAPAGTTAAFSAVCDMTRDGGGWTLLLKAGGDSTLGYNSSYWTDNNLLNETDLTTTQGNSKYPAYLTLPVTKLRGELDGYRFPMPIDGGPTAVQIFGGAANVVTPYLVPINTTANWSVQPNCQYFGVNDSFSFNKVRFGWTANQENDCTSNDTAIGLGLTDTNAGGYDVGAGYQCVSTNCSNGNVNATGSGLLWAQ